MSHVFGSVTFRIRRLLLGSFFRLRRATSTQLELENERLLDLVAQLEGLNENIQENNNLRINRMAVDFFSLLVQFSELMRQQQRRISVLEALAGTRSVQRQTRHQACKCEETRMPAEVEAGL